MSWIKKEAGTRGGKELQKGGLKAAVDVLGKDNTYIEINPGCLQGEHLVWGCQWEPRRAPPSASDPGSIFLREKIATP